VADAYRAALPGVRLLFLGAERGFERRLLEIHQMQLRVLPAAPIARQSLSGRLRGLFTVVDGIRCARRVLKTEQIQLVFGFGGYAAAAPIVAARLLGIPSVVHEANALPGLGNRVLGRFVERAYLGFAEAATRFPPLRAMLTGTPVRPEFFAAGRARRPPVGRPPRLLVTGGSQGSAFLNKEAPKLVRELGALGLSPDVCHQAGNGAEAVRARYAEQGVEAAVHAFVDDMAAELGRADFAVACAGAGTLSELAAARLPCLLVPLAVAAEDHQSANAAAFARETESLWVREDEWEARKLAVTIAELLRRPQALAAAAARLAAAARPDAARTIVDDCEALLAKRGA
jgi:UDP-N-acetylglucosamine--N-acetylmuramyl-(pentapeptide) pyrophosphoryl-undecaprenol N-acetylglucosamine transferase